MLKKIKKTLERIVILVFKIIPFRLARIICKEDPRFARCLPKGRKFIVNDYLGKFRVNVDTTYPIERQMSSGMYDKEAMSVVDSYIKEGDICFDIGANVGAISLALAKRTEKLNTVYSFEPGLFLFERLNKNISMNSDIKGIIRTFMLGISNHSGKLFWKEDEGNRGNASCLANGSDGVEVDVTTIDSFVNDQNINQVDFIKIDVEGMELEVIEGSLTTLKAHSPIVYFETRLEFENLRKRKVLKEAEIILTNIGYCLYSVKNEKIKKAHYPNFKNNTLALPGSFNN